MNILNLKKFFVAGAALVMLLGLSACHHWQGPGTGTMDRTHSTTKADITTADTAAAATGTDSPIR